MRQVQTTLNKPIDKLLSTIMAEYKSLQNRSKPIRINWVYYSACALLELARGVRLLSLRLLLLVRRITLVMIYDFEKNINTIR